MRLLYAAVICLVLSCSAGAGPLERVSVGDGAFAFVHYGQRWPDGVVRWYYNPSNQPNTLTTSEVLSTLQAAMSNWEAGCGIRFEYQGITDSAVFVKDGVTVLGWLNDTSFAGFARFYSNGASIVEGDIKFNQDKLGNTADLLGNATHEIGHLIGLDHANQAASIMFSNPYHSYVYQTRPKGDDYSACAGLYGSTGAASQTFYDQQSVVSGALTANLYISTSQPGSSAPSNTLSTIPAGTTGKIYFSTYYSKAVAGTPMAMQLVAPDGTLYGNIHWENQYSSGYYYWYWTWDGGGMSALGGSWKLLFLENGIVRGEKRFQVLTNYSLATLPDLAILAGFAAGGASFQAVSLNGVTAADTAWLVDEVTQSSGPTVTTSLPAGTRSIRLFGTSRNSRYNGQSGSGSGQGSGPDITRTLNLSIGGNGLPTTPAFSGRASGLQSMLTLQAQLSTGTDSGNLKVYVAALIGSALYFKTAGGWSSTADALFSLPAPGAASFNVFEGLDVRSLPTGTQIYVGYGTQLDQMVQQGRYGLVYAQ